MVAAIQTFGELLHWHPHVHILLTCGAFTPEGDFLELPELDLERLHAAWQESVFAPTQSTGCRAPLAEEKIEPEVVENMRTWPHSGWYSNKARGMRRGTRLRVAAEAAAAAESPAVSSTGEAAPAPPRSRASQTWAMLTCLPTGRSSGCTKSTPWPVPTAAGC